MQTLLGKGTKKNKSESIACMACLSMEWVIYGEPSTKLLIDDRSFPISIIRRMCRNVCYFAPHAPSYSRILSLILCIAMEFPLVIHSTPVAHNSIKLKIDFACAGKHLFVNR